MSKFTLFLCITATILLSGCKVTKQISKQDTQTESASKVDSSGVKKNDITKESKIETETIEEIDTTVYITSKGDIVADTAKTKGKEIAVNITKKKVTKTKKDIKETDKSESSGQVKKSEKKGEAKKEVVKDITKTGISLWWWILIVLAVLIALAWRYRNVFGF